MIMRRCGSAGVSVAKVWNLRNAGTFATQGDGMTEITIEAQNILYTIDQRLVALLPLIENRQEDHLAAYGRYWQGLATHSETPADGAEAAPDRLGLHPHYQQTSWADMAAGLFPEKTMSNLEIHQMQGSRGPGYTVILSVRIAGRLYQRVIGYAGAAGRGHDWLYIDEGSED
jgi:hypothetical protein